VRAVVVAMVLTAFLLFFVLLAIHNLFHGAAIIPSAIWLFLVGASLIGFGRERGVRRLAIDLLGAFSLKEFVRTGRPENGQNEIQFGYQIFGCRLLYFSVSADKVESIHWGTGQATSRAGRDMDDWSVAIWYDHGDPIKSQKQQKWRHPDQDIYIVGPMGRKQEIAAFGNVLLDFLRKSGASLMQGRDECTFERRSPTG